MEGIKYKPSKPIGAKIAKVRNLRGWSQIEFGEKLGGMSKSAVSRLEQSEEIEPEVLKQVCDALEVTVEGLTGFDEDTALHLTANFYEGSQVTSSSINSHTNIIHNYPLEEIVKLYEKQLQEIKAELKRELKNKGK